MSGSEMHELVIETRTITAENAIDSFVTAVIPYERPFGVLMDLDG